MWRCVALSCLVACGPSKSAEPRTDAKAAEVARVSDAEVIANVDGRAPPVMPAPTGDEASKRGQREPNVQLTSFTAQGDLDKELIREHVSAQREAIRACYVTALAKQPALEGTVQLQFFIEPRGTVTSIEATGPEPTLVACVNGLVSRIKFPAPRGGGGVQVSYPVVLTR